MAATDQETLEIPLMAPVEEEVYHCRDPLGLLRRPHPADLPVQAPTKCRADEVIE